MHRLTADEVISRLGLQPHPDQVRDDAEREAAHEVIYVVSPQVLALVASRVPDAIKIIAEVMEGRT